MTEVEIFDDKTKLCNQMAGQLLELIIKAPRGEFNLCITGGGLGIDLLTALREHPSRDLVDWKSVNIFWGDERFLSRDHPDRNEFQAEQALLADLAVNKFPFPASDTSTLQQARFQFEQTVKNHYGEVDIVFDLVLLGVGHDGHIASLFPGRFFSQSDVIVAEEKSPKPPHARLSFNYWVLNQARRVWFLASGSEKQSAIAEALGESSVLPVARVTGREQTKFFLTSDAV